MRRSARTRRRRSRPVRFLPQRTRWARQCLCNIRVSLAQATWLAWHTVTSRRSTRVLSRGRRPSEEALSVLLTRAERVTAAARAARTSRPRAGSSSSLASPPPSGVAEMAVSAPAPRVTIPKRPTERMPPRRASLNVRAPTLQPFVTPSRLLCKKTFLPKNLWNSSHSRNWKSPKLSITISKYRHPSSRTSSRSPCNQMLRRATARESPLRSTTCRTLRRNAARLP